MITSNRPTVFISYSHKDEVWKDRLMAHLAVLSKRGLLGLWDDRQIGIGEDWYDKIKGAIDKASVAILLVSANSLTSDFILREEVSQLLRRREKEGLPIFPVIVKSCPWQKVSWLSRMQVRPKDGKPLASYGGNRRDEALSNIATEVFEQLRTRPKSSPQRKIELPDRRIYVKASDALDFECDVLVLKYAQEFYGVDDMAARRFKSRSHDYPDISPKPGKFVLLSSKGQIAAKSILFVGVPELYEFGYEQIREFAISSMKILSTELPGIQHVAMTMHGVGYGLDERESFLSQIGGLVEAFQSEAVPQFLERVTIVEEDPKRAERLRDILKENLPNKFVGVASQAKRSVLSKPVKEAGLKSNAKPYVFVAMPFRDDMEDVYIFGIQGPANDAGYLCERVDMSVFTGDILSRIKARIETADLVVADVTGGNANVYLEVGYAWGKDRPTLLLAKKGDEIKFDVSGQRCIIYKSINDLAKSLKADLVSLSRQREQG
jgi:hypothetical protein